MQHAAAPRLCPGSSHSSGSKLLNYSLGISNGEYVFKLRISESEAQKSRGGRLSGSAFHLSEEKIFSRKYRKIRAAEVMPVCVQLLEWAPLKLLLLPLRLRYSNDNQRGNNFELRRMNCKCSLAAGEDLAIRGFDGRVSSLVDGHHWQTSNRPIQDTL